MNLPNKILSAFKRPWLLPIAVLGISYFFLAIWYPLPSDEEMIEHFQEHREDFVELVERYRNFQVGPDGFHSKWKNEEGTELMLKRAGIERIWKSAYSPWFPNPYTIETAKDVRAKALEGGKSHRVLQKYKGLVIKILPRRRYRATNLTYVKVWKDFYFIPEVPRIVNGELLWPFNTKGEYSGRSRTFPSLNKFPDHWKDYECVYRQIEPRWFICMCNGH